MSYIISTFEGRISDYETQIYSLQMDVRRYTNLYETLRTFKGNVENSQSNFNSINNTKKGLLEEISQVTRNSKVVTGYYNGLKDILNGTGTNVVAFAYYGLLQQISRKLNWYIDEINRCNNDIINCQTRIQKLETRISELQKIEDLAKRGGTNK